MKRAPRKMLSWILLSALVSLASACNQSGAARNSNTGSGAAGTPTSGTGSTVPAGTGTAASLAIEDLKVTSLYTKEAAENTCASFTVRSLDALGAAVADVRVTLEVQGSAGMEDKGKATPDTGLTDATGSLAATYCSGTNEGSALVLAKAGAVQVNSAKIAVAKKPSYSFTYLRSDVDPALTPADGAAADASVLYLNLLDSGPQDCTNIYFKLTKSGAPLVGESIKFSTQPDFPKGAKLAKRDAALVTEVDKLTSKKIAISTSISSGSGEFAVPVCAGVSLGTLLVSGTYVDAEGRNFTAKSPVIRITAGLTNFINMSLTFDSINGRTLKAYYNTNSDYELPVQVQLGARQDGQPITDYPVFVASEVGKITIANGGTPDKEKGTVDFKMRALSLVDNYPHAITSYTGFTAAQTRCEPTELAAWATANGKTEVLYKDLRQNWRSTLVYGIRGQESYRDANHNGVYDVGGDGFWDKNLNGVYDAGDVLTYDAGNDGLFNPNGEWFIDLPTPFIDVDEDGAYDASKDILIGDEYQVPNGKRDNDTMIWKREFMPISMGPSNYGLLRNRVQAAGYALKDDTVTYSGKPYPLFTSQVINEPVIFAPGNITTAAAKTYQSLLFLHDLCGNLLPGGTEIKIDFVDIDHTPEWGTRSPIGLFYVQPSDDLLEPSRRLLNNDATASTAKINFNVVDHPASALSYPVVSSIEIPACATACTGYIDPDPIYRPQVSCDGFSGFARISVTEPKLDKYEAAARVELRTRLSYSSYSTCTCVSGATELKGACVCDEGKSFSAGRCQ